MDAIVLQGLSKTYMNGKRAVNRISFSLKQGEVFGFLGPNGAGKTTTVKLLTGMLAPSEGEMQDTGTESGRSPEKGTRCFRGSNGACADVQQYDRKAESYFLWFCVRNGKSRGR